MQSAEWSAPTFFQCRYLFIKANKTRYLLIENDCLIIPYVEGTKTACCIFYLAYEKN
jgi:hypothetical protein